MSQLQVLRDDVQHANHLREDEYTMPRFLQPHQELVQQDQLPTALHQALREQYNIHCLKWHYCWQFV